MTGFRGWTENAEVIDPLTPETLRELVSTAQEFVVVDNPAWGKRFSARARRSGPERWQVEVRTESADRDLRTVGVNGDAAFDILRSWAAGDGWWRDAFIWDPLPTD